MINGESRLIDRFGVVLWALRYNSFEKVKELSRFLVGKVGKEGKVMIILARLFSVS